jgi:hypothetical protein
MNWRMSMRRRTAFRAALVLLWCAIRQSGGNVDFEYGWEVPE